MVAGHNMHLMLLISNDLCMCHTKATKKLLMRTIHIFDIMGLKGLVLRIQLA